MRRTGWREVLPTVAGPFQRAAEAILVVARISLVTIVASVLAAANAQASASFASLGSEAASIFARIVPSSTCEP